MKLTLNEDETFTLGFYHTIEEWGSDCLLEIEGVEIDSIKSGTWQQYEIDHFLLRFENYLFSEGDLELITVKAGTLYFGKYYVQDRYYLQLVLERDYVVNGINYSEVITTPFRGDLRYLDNGDGIVLYGGCYDGLTAGPGVGGF